MYSAPMTAKRSVLAALIKEILDAHDYGTFAVEERQRQRQLDATAARDRASMMGNPIRYVRIDYEGRGGERDQSVAGQAMEAAHRFGVMLWFGYRDAAQYEESSQAQFDQIVEGVPAEEGDPKGLLIHLEELGALDINDIPVYVGNPADVDAVLMPLGERLFAHYLEFSIILT